MKRTLFLLLLSAAFALTATAQTQAGTPEDSLAFVQATWQVTDLGKGAEARSASIRMFDSIQSIHIISYPARSFKTSIVEGEGMSMGETVVKKGVANHAMHVSVLGEAAGAKAAINGNYFNTRLYTPICYTRIGRRVFSRTSPRETFRTNGVIVLKGCGHKIDIFSCDTLSYDTATRGWKEVLAAGPMLMEDGKEVLYTKKQKQSTETFYDSRHPRSILGFTTDGKGRPDRIYMIVIDGRFPEQADGASIAECSFLCRILGLTDAINLDGGGSSTLWSEAAGVLNHPCDNRTWDHKGERRVPDIIIAK